MSARRTGRPSRHASTSPPSCSGEKRPVKRSVYWRRPTSSWPPDTLVALAARLATSGTVIPRAAARARSSVIRTSSGGPALTWTAATPGIDSSRARTVSSMKRRCVWIGPGVPGSSCTKNQDRVSFVLPLPPSDTLGRSASRGSGGSRLRRPITSTSAFFMSVPSVKRRFTCAAPAKALPSISSTPGIPCMTFSRGSSSSDSTSSGDAVRQPVWMDSSGRLMSGNSCNGRRLRLRSPSRPRNTAMTITPIGLRLDQCRLSMAQAHALAGDLPPHAWMLPPAAGFKRPPAPER